MELVSRCVECGLAEPESLASLGGSAPGVVDGILSQQLLPSLLISLAEVSCGVEISVLLIIHSVPPVSILNCAKSSYLQACLPFFQMKDKSIFLDLILHR